MKHEFSFSDEKETIQDLPRVFKQFCLDREVAEEIIYRSNLIAREMASNLSKYSDDSPELLCHLWDLDAGFVIDMLSMDRGPGFRSGTETDGKKDKNPGLGIGLEVIHRQAEEYDLYSEPGKGTVVFARIYGSEFISNPFGKLQVGVSLRPCKGEQRCGDSWNFVNRDCCYFCMSDGLGHGEKAEEASAGVMDYFSAEYERPPEDFFDELNEKLRGERGAVVARGKIKPDECLFQCSGVGNIKGSLFLKEDETPIYFKHGTVGYKNRTPRVFNEKWDRSADLFLQTDGLKTHWDLDEYPGLSGKHNAIKAALAVREFGRPNDDSMLLWISGSTQ
ncbi:MAG: hypothetical protein ACLFN5_05470 [bacterium]